MFFTLSPSAVALLAEGVDRNSSCESLVGTGIQSPSSRRAWIEIHRLEVSRYKVDGSPSSRRAWIEIAMKKLEESGQMSPSSRRAWIEMAYRGLWGRKT